MSQSKHYFRTAISVLGLVAMITHLQPQSVSAVPVAINDTFKPLVVLAKYCGDLEACNYVEIIPSILYEIDECLSAELWWRDSTDPSLTVSVAKGSAITCKADFGKLPLKDQYYFVKLRARVKDHEKFKDVTASGCVTALNQTLVFRLSANNGATPTQCAANMRPLHADVIVSGRIPEAGTAPILCQGVPGVKVTASLLALGGQTQTIKGTTHPKVRASRDRCFIKFTGVPLGQDVTVTYGGTFAYLGIPTKPIQIAGSRTFEFDLGNLDPATFEDNEVKLETVSADVAAAPAPAKAILAFEPPSFGDWKRGSQTWGTFTQSREQAYTGQFAGKFEYAIPKVPPIDSYFVFQRAVPIPDQPNAFQIWVYGDGEGNFLNIWVRDKNDRKWQFTFGRVNHNQTWQQMTAQISVAPGWPNEIVDGKPAPTGGIAYPLRLDALVIDGVDAELPSSGVIYVDDLTAVSLPAGALQAANPVAAVPAPTAAPPPSAAPVNIFFQSDRTSINAGECYTLNWNVTEVNGVWLNDQGVPGQGNQQICPSQTLTFKLKVQKRDNTFEERVLTVQATGNPQPPAANPPPVSAPAPPDSGYGTLGVIAADTRRPPESNPDLNLSLLGYQPNGAAPTFKDYGPADDPLAPQLRGLFADRRQPSFTTAFSNNGWDWNSNTPTPPSPSQYEVAVIGVAVTPGEMLFMPGSGRSIGNDYSALVLYADGNQITLKYTPEDSIARGYTVFIEGISVNPQLMAVYQSSNGAGRGSLPALKTGQQIGTAQGGEIRIAVRDNATFMDPRSLQDWWR